MRAAILSLLVIIFGSSALVLADPPTTAPTTQPALNEFTNPDYRVRFKYPANWVLPDHLPQDQAFSAHAPSSTDSRFAIISLRIDRSDQPFPDPALLIDLSDSLADYVFKNGGEHVKIQPDTLGLLPARRISFEKHSPSVRIEALYIVAVKDRVEYVFNFAAPAAVFDSLLPAVNDLLKSFEVLD